MSRLERWRAITLACQSVTFVMLVLAWLSAQQALRTEQSEIDLLRLQINVLNDRLHHAEVHVRIVPVPSPETPAVDPGL